MVGQNVAGFLCLLFGLHGEFTWFTWFPAKFS